MGTTKYPGLWTRHCPSEGLLCQFESDPGCHLVRLGNEGRIDRGCHARPGPSFYAAQAQTAGRALGKGEMQCATHWCGSNSPDKHL
jgi:hypothetical protein